jgi:hypothetical protein
LNRAGPLLAAALALLGLPAHAANPSLNQDFTGISQWLSDDLAQGLAFNAGENFDPPALVKGYYLQPDVSLGAGVVPLSKKAFPDTPALSDNGINAAGLFPTSVDFPNFALHLRMGLPGDNDVYLRFADATTPKNYKISPSIDAAVQTNSFGLGGRHHFLSDPDSGWPNLVVGLHYNHIQGRVGLAGPYNLNLVQNYNDTAQLNGEIRWSIDSVGTDAILYHSIGRWTPFGGLGYNHASGSVATNLGLNLSDASINCPGCAPITGAGSDKPEQNQGRAILGSQYQFTNWALFWSGEIKIIGNLPFQNYIAQVGAALPFEIGCGKTFFCRKKRPGETAPQPSRTEERDDDAPASEPLAAPASDAPAPRTSRPAPPPKAAPGMIFWQ